MVDARRVPQSRVRVKIASEKNVGQENKEARAPRVVEGRCEDAKGDGAIKSWRHEDRKSAEENTWCNDCQSREVGCLSFDELTTEDLNRAEEPCANEKPWAGQSPRSVKI